MSKLTFEGGVLHTADNGEPELYFIRYSYERARLTRGYAITVETEAEAAALDELLRRCGGTRNALWVSSEADRKERLAGIVTLSLGEFLGRAREDAELYERTGLRPWEAGVEEGPPSGGSSSLFDPAERAAAREAETGRSVDLGPADLLAAQAEAEGRLLSRREDTPLIPSGGPEYRYEAAQAADFSVYGPGAVFYSRRRA